MSLKRKPENGNETAEVLADQGRYEPGYEHPFAGDTGAALREDEGQHSEAHDGSDSISDGNSNSAAPERFSADYDDFLLANINTKYKTNSDIKSFYMWAKENSEHRQIQEIPPAELDSLLARMYVGMYRCKKNICLIMFQTHAFRVYRPMDDPFNLHSVILSQALVNFSIPKGKIIWVCQDSNPDLLCDSQPLFFFSFYNTGLAQT